MAAAHSKIHIVTPSWLEACEATRTRADERDHAVGRYTTLVRRISRLLQGFTSTNHRFLFEYHQFYLLGFDEDPELKMALGKLIRRGMGTIHWELSPDVTVLILNDGCHEALR